MSGLSGLRWRVLGGAGVGFFVRLACCSCSQSWRRVVRTVSRLRSAMGCCFDQPARMRCPNFWSAASASVFWFGMVRKRAIWLRPNSARFSFSHYRNSSFVPQQSRRNSAQRQNVSTGNRSIPALNWSATSLRIPSHACLPVTAAMPAPMIQPTARVLPGGMGCKRSRVFSRKWSFSRLRAIR